MKIQEHTIKARAKQMAAFVAPHTQMEDFINEYFHTQFSNRTKRALGGWIYNPKQDAGCPGILLSRNYINYNRKDAFKRYSNINFKRQTRYWQKVIAAMHNDKWCRAEYGHIFSDSIIGAFYSDDPWIHVQGILAHEVAHAVQHACESANGTTHNDRDESFGEDFLAHGKVWQNIYRMLREQYVNQHIEPIDHEQLNKWVRVHKLLAA